MPGTLSPRLVAGLVFAAWVGSAKADGMPDILGIALGMPLRDAQAKLQAQLPKYKIDVAPTRLPTIDQPVTYAFYAKPVVPTATGQEGDQVAVDVTLPPNKQVVWRIVREHFFPGKGILKKTLLASFRQKYGKESRAFAMGSQMAKDDSQIATLIWFMDEQGRLATPPPIEGSGVDPLGYCPVNGPGASIVETPAPLYGNKALTWCLANYTAVTAAFVESPEVPELYSQMHVVAVSLPIASHAGQVTMKWKDGIADGQHKQDVEKAGQQDKPKL